MKRLFQELMVVLMIGAVTAGVFAQRSGDQGRPPRDPARVVSPDKGQTPPPQNSNRQKPPDDKKRRP